MLWGAVPTMVQGISYGTLTYAVAKPARENLRDWIYRYIV